MRVKGLKISSFRGIGDLTLVIKRDRFLRNLKLLVPRKTRD